MLIHIQPLLWYNKQFQRKGLPSSFYWNNSDFRFIVAQKKKKIAPLMPITDVGRPYFTKAIQITFNSCLCQTWTKMKNAEDRDGHSRFKKNLRPETIVQLPFGLISQFSRALHQCNRDHGFESRSILNFFRLSFRNCLIAYILTTMVSHFSCSILVSQ